MHRQAVVGRVWSQRSVDNVVVVVVVVVVVAGVAATPVATTVAAGGPYQDLHVLFVAQSNCCTAAASLAPPKRPCAWRRKHTRT